MGLRIDRLRTKRNKGIVTIIAVFALVAQPLYGAVETQIARATSVTDHVVINEIAPNSTAGSEKWIELYNPTNETINLKDWYFVRNASTQLTPKISTTDTLLPSKQFYLFKTTSSFTPNASLLKLMNETGERVSEVNYPNLTTGQVYASKYDASTEFEIRSGNNVTKGLTNGTEPESTLQPTVSVTNFNTNNDEHYKGYNIGFQLNNDFRTVSEVKVVLHGANGQTSTNTSNEKLITLIEKGEKLLSTAFITVPGTYTEEFWNLDTNVNWAEFGMPSKADIIITNGDNKEYRVSAEALAYTDIATPEMITPQLELKTENFNTHNDTDYRGLNVGFSINPDFGNVKSVAVELFKDEQLLAKNTHTDLLLDQINNERVYQHSTPFIIAEGEYIEEYWNLGEANFRRSQQPNRAVVTVIGQNGQQSETMTRLDDSTASYRSLFPTDTVAPATPTVKLKDANGNERAHTGWITTENFKFTLDNPPADEATEYEVKYWNTIDGSSLNGEANAWKNSVVPYSSSLGVYSDQFSQGEGVHFFQFRAKDESGNWSPYSTPFQIGYDKTKPQVTITNPLKNQFITTDENGVLSIKGSVKDNLHANYTQVQVVDKIGNPVTLNTVHGAFADGSTITTFDTKKLGMKDGTYGLSIQSVDGAGNVLNLQEDGYIYFTLDTVKPTISVKADSVGANGMYSLVNFKLYDALKINKAYVNGVEKNLSDNQYSDVNGIAVGKNSGKLGLNTVIAEDVAGNQITYTFTLDNVAPTATFRYSNNNGNAVTRDDIIVTLTPSENISIPSGWTKINESTYEKTHTDNGKFTAEVIDIAGNRRTVSYEVKRIDRIAPVIKGVEQNGIYSESVTYSVVEQSIDKIIVDGVAYAENKAPRTITGAGTHTVKVIDKAGNTAEVTFQIVVISPEVIGENFNTHKGLDYSGITVGFRIKDAQNATGLRVAMQRVDGSVVEKVAGRAVLEMVQAGGDVQLSVPFVITEGLFKEANDKNTDGKYYWEPAAGHTWSSTTIPESVTVYVTYADNTEKEILYPLGSPFTHDTSAHVAYAEVAPQPSVVTNPVVPAPGAPGSNNQPQPSADTGTASNIVIGDRGSVVNTVPVFSRATQLSTTLGATNTNAFGFATLFNGSFADATAEDEADEDVLGATDVRRNFNAGGLDNVAATTRDASADNAAFAWYWWLAIVLAAGAILWGLTAAFRRDKTREAYFQK